jgi:hypothetical protein
LVAYVALQAKDPKKPAATKRLSGTAKRARTRDNKRSRGEGGTAKAEVHQCDSYCYVHGHNNSHNSAQCKVMKNDKATFNQAMRHAKSSGAVSGGSTAVRGKAATTVNMQAFMAATSDDETQDETSAPPPTLIVIDTESED